LAFHSGREADHSPPSSAGVEEGMELYLHSPNTPSWRGAQLGGAQGQLYLLPLKVMKLLSEYLYMLPKHEHGNVQCSMFKAHFPRNINEAVTITSIKVRNILCNVHGFFIHSTFEA
jgi:hypothetical protein